MSLSLLCIAPLLHAKVTTISDEKAFNNQKKPALVKFFASWCHVCQEVNTSYQELSDDKECKGLHFCEVDVEKVPALAQQYKVRGVPTFVYLDENGKTVKEVVGVSNIAKFKEERKQEIASIFPSKNVMARMKNGFKRGYKYVANKTRSVFCTA